MDQQPVTFNPADLAKPPQSAFGNPSASSGGIGTSPLGSSPQITPELAGEASKLLSGATYSVPGGGYISNADAQNANSYYNKFGGHDPGVTQKVEDFYAKLGALPTAPNLTPAASALAAETPGYAPKLGSPINDIIGHNWQGPWGIDPNRKPEHVGFGP